MSWASKDFEHFKGVLACTGLAFVIVLGGALLVPGPVCLSEQSLNDNFNNATITVGATALDSLDPSWVPVSGPSMSPTIKDNSLCLCVRKDTYKIGDIVDSFIQKDDGTVVFVMHRIVRSENGLYQTKGDNNDYADAWALKPEQIVCAVPERNMWGG